MDRPKPIHSKIFPETPADRPAARMDDSVPAASKDDFRVLSYQIEVLQRRVKELEARKDHESRMDLFVGRWEEFLNSAELRFEKIQEQFHRQSETYRAHIRDLQTKVSALMGSMKEREANDAALSESFERQQQSMQAFEAKTMQWQKTISNLELKSLGSDSNRKRFEKIQAHLQKHGEAVQAAFRDVRAKIEAVAGRINDRQVSESSIREMVERQQRLVQSFEFRLQQAQKVMSEQELQLMNSRSEIKETLRELARLKQL